MTAEQNNEQQKDQNIQICTAVSRNHSIYALDGEFGALAVAYHVSNDQ